LLRIIHCSIFRPHAPERASVDRMLTCMDRVKTRGLGAQPCAKHAARAACEIAAPEIGGAVRRWRSKLR
jgi:hypothetical protein